MDPKIYNHIFCTSKGKNKCKNFTKTDTKKLDNKYKNFETKLFTHCKYTQYIYIYIYFEKQEWYIRLLYARRAKSKTKEYKEKKTKKNKKRKKTKQQINYKGKES